MAAPDMPGYTNFNEIGQGGFAVVYRATQEAVGRDVAFKVLNQAKLDQETERRFRRECQVVGSLSWHPHIAAVLDAGATPDGRSYLIFELLEGGSLGDRVDDEGPIGWMEASVYAVQLADAVAAAHDSDVLHRDIKPENILIDRIGRAKLADFGIASMRDGTRTATGVITATLAHAAPEVLSGERASKASDVYGLGSTLFELIAGTPPFGHALGNDFFASIRKIVSEDAPPLGTLADVPDSIAEVVRKALEKDPAKRWHSAEEFGKAVQRAQRDVNIPVTPMPFVGRGESMTFERDLSAAPDLGFTPPAATPPAATPPAPAAAPPTAIPPAATPPAATPPAATPPAQPVVRPASVEPAPATVAPGDVQPVVRPAAASPAPATIPPGAQPPSAAPDTVVPSNPLPAATPAQPVKPVESVPPAQPLLSSPGAVINSPGAASSSSNAKSGGSRMPAIAGLVGLVAIAIAAFVLLSGGGDNDAAGAINVVSADASAGNSGELTIDGDTNTAWRTPRGATWGQRIVYDFGQNVDIDAITIANGPGGTGELSNAAWLLGGRIFFVDPTVTNPDDDSRSRSFTLRPEPGPQRVEIDAEASFMIIEVQDWSGGPASDPGVAIREIDFIAAE